MSLIAEPTPEAQFDPEGKGESLLTYGTASYEILHQFNEHIQSNKPFEHQQRSLEKLIAFDRKFGRIQYAVEDITGIDILNTGPFIGYTGGDKVSSGLWDRLGYKTIGGFITEFREHGDEFSETEETFVNNILPEVYDNENMKKDILEGNIAPPIMIYPQIFGTDLKFLALLNLGSLDGFHRLLGYGMYLSKQDREYIENFKTKALVVRINLAQYFANQCHYLVKGFFYNPDGLSKQKILELLSMRLEYKPQEIPDNFLVQELLYSLTHEPVPRSDVIYKTEG
jgi:hypothetical protein